MREQTPIKLGPLALLLTVISICLATLAILTLSTAKADLRLAQKYAETVGTRYELEIQGQEYLAGLAPAIAGYGEEGVTETLRSGLSTLTIHVKPAEDGGMEVTEWRFGRQWEEDTDLNLWPGE